MTYLINTFAEGYESIGKQESDRSFINNEERELINNKLEQNNKNTKYTFNQLIYIIHISVLGFKPHLKCKN